MEGRRTAEEIRSAFRELAEADRARDGLRPLADYQGLFAGCDDLVAEEYDRLAAESAGRPDSHDGRTVESDPPLAATLVTGGRHASDAGPDLGRIGPYRLVRELGSGGMGRVFRAVCEGRVAGIRTGQEVALKVVHSHLAEGAGFFKRFLREAEIGKRVRHPNVVRTLDVDASSLDGRPVHYLVMEYVEGQTLRALFAEIGRVPEALCLHIAREAAKGLGAIHEIGVVHRDFKPENVLITRDHVVKVMDLGVARLVDEAVRLSLTGAFVGTVPYAAPEQFLGGGKDIDGRADLYALGLTLYELATGQHPFLDEDLMAMLRRRLSEIPRPPSALNPQISPFLEEVVNTLVRKEREERFASAAELVGVLDQGEASEWWRRRSGEIRAITRRPLRRIRIPRETALFGRDGEIARLRALWERARADEGQVVLLEGEAGIGKSRLVDEFAGNLQQEGEDLHFLFGSWPPGGAATATGALSTACREQFGAEDLEAALGTYLPGLPLLVPAFAALLRGEPPPMGSEPLAKESLHTAFVEAIRALGKERPTLVLVDDLHNAPEEGRGLFTALALAVPGHRVLLVGTTRPGLPAEWTAGLGRLGHTTPMTLGRLGPKDLQRLLAEAFRSERLAEDLGGRIAAKSDGNPFFVFEILRSLREGGALRRNPDGTWVKTSEFREIGIPSSVADLVRAQVGRLAEDERNLLDVAACCGFEFDPLPVGEVLGLGKIPALQRLAAVEKAHRLVRSAGRKFVFDHHQVQEVLYGALPELLREEYHGAIGETLEKRTGAAEKDPKDLDGALCVDLASHLLKGGKGERALRYLDRAVGHLAGVFARDAALDLLGRALEAPGLLEGAARARKLLQTSELRWARGEGAGLDAVIEEVCRLAEASGEAGLRVEARSAKAKLVVNRDFDRERAIGILEEARRIAAESGDPGIEAGVLRTLATLLRLTHRFEESERLCRNLLERHRASGDDRETLWTLATLATVTARMGRCREAIAQLEEEAALARRLGLRGGCATAAISLAQNLCHLGNFEEALRKVREGLSFAAESGHRQMERWGLAAEADILVALGRWGEALAANERGLGFSEEARAFGSTVHYGLEGAWLLALCGNPGKAALRIEPIRDAVGKAGLGADLRDVEARVAEASGDLPAAERLFRETCDTREREPREEPELLARMASVLQALDRIEEAREWFRKSGEAARAVEFDGPRALAALREACLPGGDPAAALPDYLRHEERVDHRSRMETRFHAWKATGDRAHLAEAHRLLLFLRDHAPPRYRESLVVNVALHREIAAAWEAQGGPPGPGVTAPRGD